jgi:hypothetical protein
VPCFARLMRATTRPDPRSRLSFVIAFAVGVLLACVGLAGTVVWAWQAVAWRSRLATAMRDRFALTASASRASGYKVRFEYLLAWTCRSRLRSAWLPASTFYSPLSGRGSYWHRRG